MTKVVKHEDSLPAQVGLVGRWFHSLENGKISWQGVVLGSPEPGIYLVQTFEWFTGDPGVCHLIRIEDMTSWLFYLDNEGMKYSYEHGAAREGGPYRDRI